jgi:hypothetical protein
MYETLASEMIIAFCLPVLGFWGAVTYRLLAEQRMKDGGNRPKPDLPPILLTICA